MICPDCGHNHRFLIKCENEHGICPSYFIERLLLPNLPVIRCTSCNSEIDVPLTIEDLRRGLEPYLVHEGSIATEATAGPAAAREELDVAEAPRCPRPEAIRLHPANKYYVLTDSDDDLEREECPIHGIEHNVDQFVRCPNGHPICYETLCRLERLDDHVIACPICRARTEFDLEPCYLCPHCQRNHLFVLGCQDLDCDEYVCPISAMALLNSVNKPVNLTICGTCGTPPNLRQLANELLEVLDQPIFYLARDPPEPDAPEIVAPELPVPERDAPERDAPERNVPVLGPAVLHNREDVLAYFVKSCPNCRSATILDDCHGCLHITCIVCNAHFCWLCGFQSRRGDVIYEHLRRAHGGIFWDQMNLREDHPDYHLWRFCTQNIPVPINQDRERAIGRVRDLFTREELELINNPEIANPERRRLMARFNELLPAPLFTRADRIQVRHRLLGDLPIEGGPQILDVPVPQVVPFMPVLPPIQQLPPQVPDENRDREQAIQRVRVLFTREDLELINNVNEVDNPQRRRLIVRFNELLPAPLFTRADRIIVRHRLLDEIDIPEDF